MSFDRAKFLASLTEHEGAPYLWGGDGLTMMVDGKHVPSPYFGFDCLGFVTDRITNAGGPDLRAWWTDKAFAEWEPIATPEPGDCVFWAPAKPDGPMDVNHVEVVVGKGKELVTTGGLTIPCWRTIGAIGGNSKTTTQQMAASQMAAVKFRDSHLARAHFAGFRRIRL